MKTVSILFTKSPGRMHFDFSTPKGLKIIPSVTKKINDRDKKQRSARKEIKRVEEKKDLLSFDLIWSTLVISSEKKKTEKIESRHIIYITLFTPQPMIRL